MYVLHTLICTYTVPAAKATKFKLYGINRFVRYLAGKMLHKTILI